MRWEFKASLQALLSRLPLHQSLYRWLHATFGQVSRTLGDQLDRKLRLFERMRENGFTLEEKVVLEIGTGWHPVFPLLCYLAGARQVITLDLNPWLTPRTLALTIEGIDKELDRIAPSCFLPAEVLRERLLLAKRALADHPKDVIAVLGACRIEYHMPCDACATGLPDQSIDYIVSANVLEHVPRPIITGMLTEARRILRPGGRLYHHVNPGDHNSEDPRISTVHFLRYPPWAWYFIGGSGLAYHNRLRCVDYIGLVESAGFEITHTYSNIDPRALEEIRTGLGKVHARFAGYSPEQLACDITGIFATKLEAAMPPTAVHA